jgi:protein arginine N-methyltransferase 1
MTTGNFKEVIRLSRIQVCGRALPVMTYTLPKGAPFALVASEGEYPVYDDVLYEHLESDKIRTKLYEDAIARLAPGRTVLDIGTGRGALWALASARAGARKVYAIEVLPGPAAQARAAVAQAGYADVITVIEGLSTRAQLPERAHVCVSEIIGSVASSEGAIAV